VELYLYSSYNVFIAWTGKILAPPPPFFTLVIYQYYCCSKINYVRSLTVHFTPGKETRYPTCRRLGGGPRDGLDGCRRSRLHWNSILGPSISWRVAIPTTMSLPLQNYISAICSFPLICCLYDFFSGRLTTFPDVHYIVM